MNPLKIFVGFLLTLFGGCIVLILVGLTGSETLTYGVAGFLVLITFLFLFLTNYFAQEK
ncbi:hypothetical protein ACFLU5_16795 [Bacteroidota bacterium]